MDVSDREATLQTHVRALLLQYALTHLATNYFTWTKETVSDLLSNCLVHAPLVAPTSVTLPVDPFEYLSQKWGLSNLENYEERLEVDTQETLPYLRRLFAPLPRQIAASQLCWSLHTDGQHEAFRLSRPLSPILTTRARQETPKLGLNMHAVKLPQSTRTLLSSCHISQAQSFLLEETDTPIIMDDALGNKLSMDPEIHRGVLEVINSVPNMGQSRAASATRTLANFLRTISPPPQLLEPEMVPVFSRRHRPGLIRVQSPLEEPRLATLLQDVPGYPKSTFSPVEDNEEDEGDLANEHLVLVDGWHAIKTSSSPLALTPGTPSLADSSSEIDELMMPSSDVIFKDDFLPMGNTEPRMIPRTARLGGLCAESSLPGEGTNLSAFLSPLLVHTESFGPRIICSPKSQPSSPLTTITTSLLGQPPSTLDDSNATQRGMLRRMEDVIVSSDDSIAFAVKTAERACGDRLGDEDPATLIMGERLDEKDSLLMDVPMMRSPNDHAPGDCIVPTRMTELVAPTKPVATAVTWSGFLKKAKGLQPLQIELSWIPFKYGRTVPTDEEVADVVNDPCPQLAKGIDIPQHEIVSRLAELLDGTKVFGSQPVVLSSAPSNSIWATEDGSEISTADSPTYTDDSGLVLTRGDRRRLAGLPLIENEDEEDAGSSDKENEFTTRESRRLSIDGIPYSERPTKRVRFQNDDRVDTDSSAFPVDALNGFEHDDSGVFFAGQDGPLNVEEERSSFEQLVHDSEDFGGPLADGNLFPDMHPVHYDDYYFERPPSQLATDMFVLNNQDFCLPSPSSPDALSISRDAAFDAATADLLNPSTEESELQHLCILPSGPATLTGNVNEPLATSQPVPQDYITNLAVPLTTKTVDSVYAPSSVPVLTVRQSLASFLAFCGKTHGYVKNTHTALSSIEVDEALDSALPLVHAATSAPAPRDTPPELLNDKTWLLPASYERSTTVHRYMASMNLIQRRALVRALSTYCSVDLVEREHLGEADDDVHLIVDCDSAVLFTPLEMLPGRCDALVALLTRLSWQYSHLLVVFECYPSDWDYRGDKDSRDRPVASVWSPPVVKAVRKLRRDLSISEGLQTKCAKTTVEYAFANTVEEGAVFARLYGDAAEGGDATRGAVWGMRLWLTHEERDGEYDLSRVDGMNLFAASLLLSRTTLEDLLEQNADDRYLEYGELIGTDRITRFNLEMLRRLEAMQLPPSSPFNGEIASSSNSIPCFESDVDVKGAYDAHERLSCSEFTSYL